MATAKKPIRETSPESSKDSGYSSTISLKSAQQMETVEQEIATENQRKNEILMQENVEKVNEFSKRETFRHLQTLLDRSEVYSELILARFQKEKEEKTKLEAKLQKKKQNSINESSEDSEAEKSRETEEKPRRSTRSKFSTKSYSPENHRIIESNQHFRRQTKKTKANERISEFFDENEMVAKKSKYEDGNVPNLNKVVGEKEVFCCDLKYFVGTLRDYQMDGLMWLKAQYEQAVNGILADEMGLGKTIQVIALFCHFYAKKMTGPFLIVVPLSTLINWWNEFARFAPKIPVVLFHGDKVKRKKLLAEIWKGSNLDGLKVSPVVLTSYEMILHERLTKFKWRYMVIDEGHRIKNNACLLKRELALLTTCNRLLLTGTPLQNNLKELWSLLNFLLPDVFTDISWFESFFDLNEVYETGGESKIVAKEQEQQIITKLHRILAPFLLRRIKSEVELDLPPKKEIWVYAPMSPLQIEMYKAAVEKYLLQFIGQKVNDQEKVQIEIKGKRKSTLRPGLLGLQLNFETEEEQLANCEEEKEKPMKFLAERRKLTGANMMMAMRKICLHPYLFEYPLTDDGEYKIDEDLVRQSGKFAVFDRLLSGLLKKGHKILLFSQMCMVLDIIHDLLYLRNIKFCRLDGNMDLNERQEQIELFAKESDVPIFLISTKAGGLGLNLISADTVIIFDSDWNPQGDIQAQDRCHRIGQTKPVVVYRLICRGTIDEKVILRASAKRRLEKMVIHKGNFNFAKTKQEKVLNTDELLELLKSTDYNQIMETGSCDQKIISDEDLEILLDRSNMTTTPGDRSKQIEECGAFKILPNAVEDIVL